MPKDIILEHVKRHVEYQYPNMHGWCSIEKALDIAECVIDLNAHSSVEVGVFGGKSLLAFALAHEAVRHGKVVGIDPWTAAACQEGHNDEKNNEWWTGMVNLNKIYLDFEEKMFRDYNVLVPYCNWLRLKGEEAAPLFPDKSIDILHDDGNHSEELTCANYHSYKDKLKDHSIVIIDDTDWPTVDKAVKLWKEYGYQTRKDAGSYIILERLQ